MRPWTKRGALLLLGAPVFMGALASCNAGRGPNLPAIRLLSPAKSVDLDPNFSPDGHHVAYVAQGTHDLVVTIADSDLTHPIAVDSAPWARYPVWSPDGRRVAYGKGANLNLWAVPLAGGIPHQLTNRKGNDLPIQWEPDGDWLIYAAIAKAGEVGSYRVNIKTGRTMPVPAPAQPAIAFRSPDESQIAYDVFAGDRRTLWVSDSLGAHARQLTTEGFETFAVNDGAPNSGSPWSPDGSELLYDSRRTGRSDVWVLRVADDSAWQLTRDVRADYDPVWSPDGMWVAFLSDRGQQTDIWMIPTDGGPPVRVTDDPAQEDNLQWVGQSETLSFTTGAERNGLWTHSLASGAERRLTPDSIRVGGYDLSPDRTRVVFVARRGGGVGDIELLDIATGHRRTLVADGSLNQEPVWSPDGSQIAFTSNRTGNIDVWAVDTAGGQPRDLTGWPGIEGSPHWSADGTSIYFAADRDAHPLVDLWEVPATGGEARRLTHLGTMLPDYVAVDRTSGDVFAAASGGSQGQTVLYRLRSDGTLQTLWDRTSVVGLPDNGLTPSGDSIAVAVAASGGGWVTMLLPTHGGQGRQILGSGTEIRGWSSDGTRAVYQSGTPNADLYVLTVRDSAVQRITDTPASEAGRALFLAGDTSVVFYRGTLEQRIATVDVSKLMAAEARQ